MSKKKKTKNILKKIDKYILEYVPKFFEILGWTTLLGFLQYAANINNSWIIWTVFGISFLAMNFYISIFINNKIFKEKGYGEFGQIIFLGLIISLSLIQLTAHIINQFASSSVN